MSEELDFSDYPNLHLELMIDDYQELLQEAKRRECEKIVQTLRRRTKPKNPAKKKVLVIC
ncbi:hypothetical protein G3570_03095 [Balneolaceae bacterium YR4-1]|uniref:Uncharacterized protein n=1 Tax=Halalkalibaculum roseum TaxID=2709311 RepID=A0A6M1T5M4_9BACT|nr:hypothetical protein [Halalkalibaculum roseum]NGP75603.1 hypothetical protein [Halalkalibaculum roseum]